LSDLCCQSLIRRQDQAVTLYSVTEEADIYKCWQHGWYYVPCVSDLIKAFFTGSIIAKQRCN
jgi:hypothetical protein